MPRAAESEVSVFVNCPFDGEYDSCLKAIVFTIHDCGFVVRSALESHDSAETRIDKIVRIVRESILGIHDLSRTELDPDYALPRFNIPLELGIFLGAQRFGTEQQRRKRCLILDKEPYRYQKFCSDIAGQDIKSHYEDPVQVVRIVRDWLSDLQPNAWTPSGSVIWTRYSQFQSDLPLICAGLRLDRSELTFTDHCMLIAEWLRLND